MGLDQVLAKMSTLVDHQDQGPRVELLHADEQGFRFHVHCHTRGEALAMVQAILDAQEQEQGVEQQEGQEQGTP